MFLFLLVFHFVQWNSIWSVMVCVNASSAVDRGASSGWVKPRTIKLVFVAFQQST